MSVQDPFSKTLRSVSGQWRLIASSDNALSLFSLVTCYIFELHDTMSGAMRQYQEPDGAPIAIEQAIQNMKQQKKRKRASPDQNGHERNHGPRSNASIDSIHRNGHNIIDVSQNYFDNNPNTNSSNINSITQHIARHVASVNVMPTPAAAALAASMPQLTVPQPTELSFPSTNSGNDDDRQLESSFEMSPPDNHNRHTEGTPYNLDAFTGDSAGQMQATRDAPGNGGSKPAVGSDEWHKVRRDNHKEGEWLWSQREKGH